MSETQQVTTNDGPIILGSTSDIEWRNSYERFTLMGVGEFDVNAARTIAAESPRDIQLMDAESVSQWWRAFGAFLFMGSFGYDHADDDQYSLGIPAFIGETPWTEGTTPILFDGWHRVRKAHRLGEPMAVTTFTLEEVKTFHTPWR